MAVTDIIIAPATIYHGPVGEAIPDETSVDYGDAWGGNWVNAGYTMQPLSMMHNRDIFGLEVEQLTGEVKRRVTKEVWNFETVLAEATPTNLQLAVGGTVSTTAAGASQRAFQDLDVGGATVLDELSWGFEGFYENASGVLFPYRIFVWKANAVLNGAFQFAKAAGSGIPIQIRALIDDSQADGEKFVKIQRVTAVATS